MIDDQKLIAIIPARSGSKGLKDKNIRHLAGKPMMAYTILVAKQSDVFDEIFVSTDSPHYAGIAKQYGRRFPFCVILRLLLIPPLLGNTSSRIIEIIREHLESNKISIKKQFFDVEFIQ